MNPPDPSRPRQKTKADRQLLKSFSDGWHGRGSVDLQTALAAIRAGADASMPFSASGLSPFLRACAIPGAHELVALMALKPAVAQSRDPLGRSGLHLAAVRGAHEHFSALIQAGLLEARDHSGETPLAAAINANNWPAALALANLGADLLAQDHSGFSCLQKAQGLYASARGVDAAFLGENGADALLELGYAQAEKREILSGLPLAAVETSGVMAPSSNSTNPADSAAGGNAAAPAARRRRL